MDEARLVRFGAGKAHLGAAFYAQRLVVETLSFVIWHTPNPRRYRSWANQNSHHRFFSGKQLELAPHSPDTPLSDILS
jgi:hypothetical protein